MGSTAPSEHQSTCPQCGSPREDETTLDLVRCSKCKFEYHSGFGRSHRDSSGDGCLWAAGFTMTGIGLLGLLFAFLPSSVVGYGPGELILLMILPLPLGVLLLLGLLVAHITRKPPD